MIKRILFIIMAVVLMFSCKGEQKSSSSKNLPSKSLSIKNIPPKGNLEGFNDIKWGDSISVATNILKEKKFKIISTSDEQLVTRGNFAGSDASIILFFYKDKFYFVGITYYNKMYYEYSNLIDMLKEKYGEPNFVDNENDRKSSSWEFENNAEIVIDFFSSEYGTSISLLYNNIIMHEEKKKADRNDIINKL